MTSRCYPSSILGSTSRFVLVTSCVLERNFCMVEMRLFFSWSDFRCDFQRKNHFPAIKYTIFNVHNRNEHRQNSEPKPLCAGFMVCPKDCGQTVYKRLRTKTKIGCRGRDARNSEKIVMSKKSKVHREPDKETRRAAGWIVFRKAVPCRFLAAKYAYRLFRFVPGSSVDVKTRSLTQQADSVKHPPARARRVHRAL